MTKLRNTFLTIGLTIATTFAFIQPAQASEESTTRISEDLGFISAPITASVAKLNYERPTVSSTPASQYEAPVVAVQYTQPEAVTTETSQAPVAKKNVSAPVTEAKKNEAKPVAPNVPTGQGSVIASAALAQLGINQDCTALVSNALSAAGIHFHGWPAEYLSLGTPTSNPVPGDLIYYANGGTGFAHIAVYIGNGQAVHGGWNGGTTAIFSANVGSGPVYIHI